MAKSELGRSRGTGEEGRPETCPYHRRLTQQSQCLVLAAGAWGWWGWGTADMPGGEGKLISAI